MTGTPFEGPWAGSPPENDHPLARRQLEVLRSTYPAWEIHFRIDAAGAPRWTAELRRPVTAQLTANGVRERIGGPDAITLASALAHQSSLLHNGRTAWPPA
ncbi:hypothetical protein [Nonomuraea sp. NPDC049709]|uniref:hypothetical protein n=1 Tax=Nonomuraea sp. NPDC049709 TaxID=3154736 RepID=UPI003446FAE7